MYEAEVGQLRRVEEAKTHLRAQEEALQARVDEETRLLADAAALQSEAEAISVSTETETPELKDNSSELETSAEAESLHPLETWQFALVDETEVATPEVSVPELSVNSLETEQPDQAIAESDNEIELPEFDLQSELAKLEADASSFIAQSGDQSETTAEEEIELTSDAWAASPLVESFETPLPPAAMADSEKSVDLLHTEKGIQTSGDGRSISALTEGLKSGDSAKRAATLQELAQWDDDDAFGLITSLFDDSSADVRNAAARALYEFKPDRAASFTRALREGSAERRRNIAGALSGSGLAAEAIDSLAGEGREKTYDAFSILFLMAKAGEVQTLLQTIEKHPEVAVRLAVIRLLTFSNQPDIIPAFRSLAVRGSLPTEVRSAVMEAIYQISNNARENSLSAA